VVAPNDDIRSVATARPVGSVAYRSGFSFATGLPDASADVVIAVQAMHWMEPVSTTDRGITFTWRARVGVKP
jgi:hypothetical protein